MVMLGFHFIFTLRKLGLAPVDWFNAAALIERELSHKATVDGIKAATKLK